MNLKANVLDQMEFIANKILNNKDGIIAICNSIIKKHLTTC